MLSYRYQSAPADRPHPQDSGNRPRNALHAGITALTKEISADLLQSVTIYPDGRMDIRLNLADEIKALMETLHREFCTA